jgi:hypothetical protein
MPLLVPICFLTFFFYYWVDKFALLRFYSLPPRLDATLARAVGNVLEYSVFLHLLFGMWMMSNEVRMGEERSDEFARPAPTNPLTQPYCLASISSQEFFKTEDINLSTNSTGLGVAGIPGGVPAVSIDDASSLFGDSELATEVNDRLTHKNNLVSLLIFVLLIVRLVWIKILAKVFRAYKGIFTMFPCLERCFSDEVEAEGNPPFIEALSTEMMDIQVSAVVCGCVCGYYIYDIAMCISETRSDSSPAGRKQQPNHHAGDQTQPNPIPRPVCNSLPPPPNPHPNVPPPPSVTFV